MNVNDLGKALKAPLAKLVKAHADRFRGHSEHHARMAEMHAGRMNAFAKGSDEHEFHKAARQEHLNESEEWAALADVCEQCCKDIGGGTSKAMMGDELEPLPSGFSVLAPTAPDVLANLVRVDRPGSPPAQMPKVAEGFEALVRVE